MTPTLPTRLHPAMQFVILVCITLALMAVGTAAGMGIIAAKYGFSMQMITDMNDGSPSAVHKLWILQISSATIPLVVAPVFFATVIVREPQSYLKANMRISPLFLLLALAVMIVSTPFLEELIVLNQRMVLPHFLKGLEEAIRQMETQAEATMKVMLQMNTIGDLIFNLLLVGLLTAVAEEFLFRGCVQTIFMRWTRRPHMAIWITAALFSFFHFEFYGFLPRMVLGVLFGYFAWRSGSIWPAVLGHFFNNGFAVLVTYLYQHHQIKVNPDDNAPINPLIYILSLILTVFLLLVYKRIALTEKQEPQD